MYLDILIINHHLEDNLKTHLEEVYLEEIPLESHLLIHILDLYGWLALGPRMLIAPSHQLPIVQPISESTTKLPYMKLQYLTYRRPNPNVHIRVFKKAIKTNNEIMEANIINLFGFTFKDNISKCGENYIQDHQNCNFGLSLYNLF
jgi:hypothetical protein